MKSLLSQNETSLHAAKVQLGVLIFGQHVEKILHVHVGTQCSKWSLKACLQYPVVFCCDQNLMLSSAEKEIASAFCSH